MTSARFETRVTSEALLYGSPFVGYSYSYPHKTAYRPLSPSQPLEAAWKHEKRDALFLYLHVPFCEMRCGFCNLLTTSNSSSALWTDYLDAMEKQALVTNEALKGAMFARIAIGGGTPTYLPLNLLERLLRIPSLFGCDLLASPLSVETSPGTAEITKLRLLKEAGADRISIGAQSFRDDETRSVGRSQDRQTALLALETIREVGFTTLNIDLIYGLPGQTTESWEDSLNVALIFEPDEFFLYPLYVRPKTGLARRDGPEEDRRLELYQRGRSLLLDRGYDQISLRMFRRTLSLNKEAKPIYCCQEDGMVGLGCGARSYAGNLHYATEYAVSPGAVHALIREYSARSEDEFRVASYGYVLDDEDQRRRYLIQSLLQTDGITLSRYRARFGTDLLTDLPELSILLENDLATITNRRLRLSERGLERSDVIGPWLYSSKARARMGNYEWR